MPALTYATDLGQASALRRTMYNLGKAIQSGELVPASQILEAFFKANPQYVSSASDASPASSSSSSSSPQSPLANDFQTLATAISNNQVGAAQTAWTQIKSDFAKAGVTNLGDGTSATTEALAQSNAATDGQIFSDMFGASQGGNSSISELIGGGSNPSGQMGVSGSLMEEWLTYKQGGPATPAANASGTANLLDTKV